MAIVCRLCGQRNPGGATFCANPSCGAYLSWEGDRTGTMPMPLRPAEPAPEQPAVPRGPGPMPAGPPREPRTVSFPAPGGAGDRGALAVRLSARAVSVEPGETAAITVTLTNGGSRVEQFTLVVLGPAAAWSSVEPASVPVYPGARAECVVRFSPPRSSAVLAGATPFAVRVSSEVHAGLFEQVDGVVTVGAFRDLTMTMAPQRSRGRGRTTHRVRVRNAGNVVEPVRVEAADPDGVVRFVTPVGETPAPPGDHGIDVVVRPRFRLFGRPRQYAFQVTATPRSPVPAVRLDGSRESLAFLPRWVAVLSVLVILVGCLAGGAAMFVPRLVGSLHHNTATNNHQHQNQKQNQTQKQQGQNNQNNNNQNNNQNNQNNNQATVHAQDELDIPEGQQADLDGLTLTDQGADIAFQKDDNGNRFVVPENGAKLAPLGQVDNATDAANQCAGASLGTDPVQADGFNQGDVLCVSTSENRLAVAIVQDVIGDSPGTLKLAVTTFDR